MENQNAQVDMSVEFVMETKNQCTEVSTFWFKAQVSGHQWSDFYLGMSKKGEWVSCNTPFFSVDTPIRNQVLSAVRKLQRTMK